MRYRIKEYRLKKGLTQNELSEKVGCSRQYINELENSEVRNISSHLLIKLSEVLEVKAEQLFNTN